MPLYTRMPDAMAFRVPCSAEIQQTIKICLESSKVAGERRDGHIP